MTRTPGQRGAPTHPAGEGRRRTLPQARGSPTSSGRRNRTASSRPRRRGAPASPQTSRRGRCWMSPAPRPSGPTGLPSDPEGPGRPPPGNPAPREPRSRSPRDPGPPRPAASRSRTPQGGNSAPPRRRGPSSQPYRHRPGTPTPPEKTVTDRRDPDAGRPALATLHTAASGTGMFTSPP